MTDYFVLWLLALVFILSAIIIFMSRGYGRQHGHGYIVVTQDESGKKVFSLEIDKDPEELESMKAVTFKIVKKDVAA